MKYGVIIMLCIFFNGCSSLIYKHTPSVNVNRWQKYQYVISDYKVTIKLPKSSYVRELAETKRINNQIVAIDKNGIVIVSEKNIALVDHNYDYTLYCPTQFFIGLDSADTRESHDPNDKPKLSKNITELEDYYKKLMDESKVNVVGGKYLEVFQKFKIGGDDYNRFIFWFYIDDYQFIGLYVTYGKLIWNDPNALAIRKEIVKNIIANIKIDPF